MRALAWPLGVIGAVVCALTIPATLAVGFTDQPLALSSGYGFGILMGILGALIATRDPRNGIGWLMILTSIVASLTQLPTDYAYQALVRTHGAWPLGVQVLWFSSWSGIPLFSLLLPEILARFPDGKMRRRWHIVDWLAIAGTLMFLMGVALAPSDIGLVSATVGARLFPFAHNPLGFSLPSSLLAYLYMSGLLTVLSTYVVAAASVAVRFRHARGVERIQLKWFAYACVLVALTCVYAGVAWWLNVMLGQALVPFEIVLITLPVAIGIAILRYRLFDIDLIINRTLVYASLTAILGALYTAVITFLNRFFISATGQKSDAAYVLTAFIVVVAFGPLKDWLQRKVDRRLGGATAAAALDEYTSRVEAVVSVIDVNQVACRFLDRAVNAFGARGAVLYLDSDKPAYLWGQMNGGPNLEVSLCHEGRQMGRLVLAERRGHTVYAERDRAALQRSADTVAQALALAAPFTHRSRTTRG